MANRTHYLAQVCRQHGLPLTPQRRTVFEAISGRTDHPTADQIYDQIKHRLPSISRTTVYRILDTFVALGLVRKICHHGSAARYDPKINQHHHLVCMHCDTIIDLESPALDKLPWPDVRRHGFEISDYHIHFRGICAKCRAKQNKPKNASRTANRRGAIKKRLVRRKKPSHRKGRPKS